MNRTHFLMLCALAGFLAAGCQGEAPPAGDAPAEDGVPADAAGSEDAIADAGAAVQFESPEAVYKAAAEAAEQRDFVRLAGLMTEPSQQIMAGGLIFSATFMAMNDEAKDAELQQLLGQHGIDPNANNVVGDQLANADPETVMKQLTEPIDDLPKFIGELLAWIETQTDMGGRGLPELGELGPVTVDGDTARAQLVTEQGPQAIEFRKVDGGWRIHLPTEGMSGQPAAPVQ